MENQYFIFVIFIIYCSCNKNTKADKFFYTKFNKDKNVIEKYEYVKIANYINDFTDSIVLYNKLGQKQYEYIEIVDVKNDFFRMINGSMYRTHSVLKYQEVDYVDSIFSPFLSHNSNFTTFLNYKIDTTLYELLIFSEKYSSHESVATIYCKKFGFICYYILDEDVYYILDSIYSSGNISQLNNELHALSDLIINDSNFFANTHLSYPTRPKGNIISE